MQKCFPCLRVINLPCIVTLLSPVLSTVSVLLAATGRLRAALLIYPLAFVCDALDGVLARKLDRCTEAGVQLDSLADMVSFGIVPVLLLFFSGGERFVLLIGAVPYLGASGARLAYFNIHGLDNGRYVGLTITMSALITYLMMALLACFAPAAILPAGTVAMIALAVLMTCGLRLKKTLSVYVLGSLVTLAVYVCVLLCL